MIRVLHLSHNNLPDVRVEKEAITLARNGVECFFAGGKALSFSYKINPFKRNYELFFDKMAILGINPWWDKLKLRLKQIISICKPDIIHAHNIIAARLALELGFPFIYDDHEYWSENAKAKIFHKYKVNFKYIYYWRLWKRWEKKIIPNAIAIITICNEIANEHKKMNKNVIVLPNFPTYSEVKELRKNHVIKGKLHSVYIGSLTKSQTPVRDMSGFIEIFIKNDIGNLIVIGDNKLKTKPPIYSIGFLKHEEMMRELTKYHIGIVPWKRNPYHKYCNPNKPYEYAHGGLIPIVTNDLTPVIRSLKQYCITFKDYSELTEYLKYYCQSIDEVVKMGRELMIYARQELIWDRFEHKLIELYNKLL